MTVAPSSTSSTSSTSSVERSLGRARRRLALRAGLVRAGWSLLAGVVLLEVGLAAGAAAGVAWAWVPGAVALALAPALLVLAPRPAPSVAAAVLDARLGTGATLVSAVEALEGRHPRFGARVVAEADEVLAGRSLREALPLQAPAGLLLGAAAAALLPAVLLGGRAGLVGTSEAGPAAPTLALDLRPSSPGGGPAAAEPEPDAPLPEQVLVAPAKVDAEPGADPLGALAPDVAAALRERLEAALADLPAPAASPGGDAASSAGDDADPLGQALRQGDAAGALRALDDLARAAAQGDRRAARRLDDLAREAARPGAGSGAGAAGDADAPPGDARERPSSQAWRGSGRERLPLELELASRRYFEAATGAERRGRR